MKAVTTTTRACAAASCDVQVLGDALMCRKHWWMVPRALRDILWSGHVPGRCIGRDRDGSLHEPAQRAIAAVAAQEGRQTPR